MPIRYAPLIPAPVKEFVEPTSSDYFIWWLFRSRCVMCHKAASEINEILPRGRSKKNLHDWKNRVTLCHECHMEYHKHGVTRIKILAMQAKREQFLLAFGREEYLDPVHEHLSVELLDVPTFLKSAANDIREIAKQIFNG
jgi:hypothetical protein